MANHFQQEAAASALLFSAGPAAGAAAEGGGGGGAALGVGWAGAVAVPKTEGGRAGGGGVRRTKKGMGADRKAGAAGGAEKLTSIRKSCDFCNKRKKKCDGDGVNPCRYAEPDTITP